MKNTKTFVGHLPDGGIIRHGDRRGLPGAARLLARVHRRTAAATAECRKRLKDV